MSRMPRRAPTAIYGGQDPRDLPAFPLWEVSHILWTARPTLARWAFGNYRQKPLIEIADPNRRLLSFNNLAELHVVSSIRNYSISLQHIRRAVDYIGHELGHPRHPLLAEELATDGASLFIEQFGRYIDVSHHGQLALAQVVTQYLSRIERDPAQHSVVKMFPFSQRSRTSPAPNVAFDQPRVVAIDARVQYGRPVIAGTRVPTAELALRFSAGEKIEEIAEDMDLDPQAVQHAIRYELAPRTAQSA